MKLIHNISWTECVLFPIEICYVLLRVYMCFVCVYKFFILDLKTKTEQQNSKT